MSWPEFVSLLVGVAALFIALFHMISAGHVWEALVLGTIIAAGIYLGLTL